MRSGYVAVVGRANAGKSTLINVLVGEKVSIVSPKPQTTRNAILGVLTKEDYQIVFVDTPGIYKGSGYLNELMTKAKDEACGECDFILFVVDGHEGVSDGDIELIKKYSEGKVPMAVAFTKIDIMPKEKIAPEVQKILDGGIDCDVFPVSARKYVNLKNLENYLADKLPEGEAMVGDIVSDRSEKFMVAELMREKLLLKFDDEIPHGVGIVVNKFERSKGGMYEINLDIVCDKQNHKAIIIGKQGRAIKEVSAFAREAMEKFLGAKVFLTTYVRVEENWRNRPGLVKDIFVV